MSENNLNSIQFFQNIKDKFPLRENGELNYSKIGASFVEGLGDTEEDKYICGKIPEVYVSGRARYQPLYDYYYQIKPQDKTTSTDKLLFDKLIVGDCSDMGPLLDLCEQLDSFGTIASPIIEKYIKSKDDALVKLWEENRVLPASMQAEVKKYRSTYDQIINSSGMFLYNDNYYKAGSTMPQVPEEDRERVEFAEKLCKIYESVANDALLNSTSETMDSVREEIEKVKQRIEELTKELEMERAQKASATEKKSGGLTNFFKGIFGAKDQKETPIEEDREETIRNNLDGSKNRLNFLQGYLADMEEQTEIYNNIVEGYNELIRNKVVPEIKEATKDHVFAKQMEGFISYFFSDEALKAYGEDALTKIGEKIEKASDMPPGEYNDLFYYGLINIRGMANAFLRFETEGPKELIPTLSIIRDELIKNPVYRSDKLSLKFRENNPRGLTSFYDSIPRSEALTHYLSFEENVFEDLMKINDLDAYIKKVGILCYCVLHDFPYDEGNGRTIRMLMNILLAHRDIIIPSLYNSIDEKSRMLVEFDELGLVKRDYAALGNLFLDKVREIGKDLSGQDRLKPPVKQEEKAEQPRQ